MEHYLVIDIARTHCSYALVSDELDFLEKGRIQTDINTKEELFGPLTELVNQFKGRINGVSITMPGVIDREKGVAYSGGVYAWVRNMNYAEELEKRFGLPVVLCNDAKAACMAELGYGNLKGVRNGIMIMILNTGIGGAIVADGKLLNGEHFAAGEFSYMRGDYRERDGIQDMFALSNNLDGLSKCVEETSGRRNMNAMRIFAKLQMEDEAVLAGVKKYCDMLATYIYNMQCIVDSRRVVIGGSIADEKMIIDLIQEAVDRKFDNFRYQNIFKPEIRECCFHSNARMYGAVYNYRDVMKRRRENKEE